MKVGKGWRIGGHDPSFFLEANAVSGDNSDSEHVIAASSVIDIAVYGSEDAMRIINPLSAALIAKPPELSRASIQTQYIEQENKVRVMLWGDILFTSAMMDVIITITGKRMDEQMKTSVFKSMELRDELRSRYNGIIW